MYELPYPNSDNVLKFRIGLSEWGTEAVEDRMSLFQRVCSLANDSSAQNRFACSSGPMDPQELGSTNFVGLRNPRFVGLMVKNPATCSIKPSVDVRVVLLVDLWGSEPLQNFTGLSSTGFCCCASVYRNKQNMCYTTHPLFSSPRRPLVATPLAG